MWRGRQPFQTRASPLGESGKVVAVVLHKDRLEVLVECVCYALLVADHVAAVRDGTDVVGEVANIS